MGYIKANKQFLLLCLPLFYKFSLPNVGNTFVDFFSFLCVRVFIYSLWVSLVSPHFSFVDPSYWCCIHFYTHPSSAFVNTYTSSTKHIHGFPHLDLAHSDLLEMLTHSWKAAFSVSQACSAGLHSLAPWSAAPGQQGLASCHSRQEDLLFDFSCLLAGAIRLYNGLCGLLTGQNGRRWLAFPCTQSLRTVKHFVNERTISNIKQQI